MNADFRALKVLSDVLSGACCSFSWLATGAVLFRACVSRFRSGVARDGRYAGSPRYVSVEELVKLLAGSGELLIISVFLNFILCSVFLAPK